MAMQVKKTEHKGLKYAFSVTVSAAELDEQFNNKLAEAAARMKMPGFRPGKIPLNVVRKKHGKAVMGEVLEHALQHGTHTIVRDNNLRPALQPKVEVVSYKEGSDLEFSVALETYPEVPEYDPKGLSLVKLKVDISEKDIEDALERLAKAAQDFVAPEKARAAKEGDIVVIDFLGKINGKPFEGGAAQDYRLTLGSGQFINGFETQIAGKKKGDAFVVSVTFPENYNAKKLAGKDAEFDVTLKDILEPKPASIDDALAKKLGVEDLPALKEEIRKQLEKDYEDVSKVRLKRDMFDVLDKAHTFEVPEGMVQMEYEALIGQAQNTGDQKTQDGKEKEKQEKEYRRLAERRVRLGILLADIGRRHGIEVTMDELRQAVFEQARQYPGQEQRVVEFYQTTPGALDQLKGPILEDKVVDFLLKGAAIAEKKAASAEILKDATEEE